MANKSDSDSIIPKTSAEEKEKHINICFEKNVTSSQTTGFEKFYLVNDPSPEIKFEDIDTSCSFLGKSISAPLIILPITGGNQASSIINKNLARAAQELGIVMSVGSQRLAIEDHTIAETYQVRDVAPDIPLLANLGAIYLNYGYGLDECKRAVEMIDADALCLYLNPMQKIFQGSMKLNFNGIIEKIAFICERLDVPVIVKEVGFGMPPETGLLLEKAGVTMLDVSGAGGTSWVKITKYLDDDNSGDLNCIFDEWGIPTVDTLFSVRKALKNMPLIASGGIRNGMEMAKALALGADYTGMALPFIPPAVTSCEAVKNLIKNLIKELKIAMFGCGVKRPEQLSQRQCIKKRL